MPTQDQFQAAIVGALAAQPREISYPDYKTSADFPLWLSGYSAKIRDAYGFKLDETDKVKAEIVRGISGKLSVGTALEAYLGLSEAEKSDYAHLVARLTAEFCDPIEKRKFEDNLAYNKRKAGQSLKEYKQAIVKDMNRYSSIPAKITNAAGTQEDNPEKEKQEVKRFRAGLRDPEGKKDRNYSHHMRYHLMEDKDLTWKNAMGLASRWEIADSDSDKSDEALSEESDDSNDEVEITRAESKKRNKTSKKDGNSISALSDEITENQEEAVEVKPKKKQKSKAKFARGDGVVASLSDQVSENQERIANLEAAQEHLAEAFKGLKTAQDAMNKSINALAAKIDAMFMPYAEDYSGDAGGASAW